MLCRQLVRRFMSFSAVQISMPGTSCATAAAQDTIASAATREAKLEHRRRPHAAPGLMSANVLPSATIFSSSGDGLNWSPMVAWNSFILASTFAGPS